MTTDRLHPILPHLPPFYPFLRYHMGKVKSFFFYFTHKTPSLYVGSPFRKPVFLETTCFREGQQD